MQEVHHPADPEQGNEEIGETPQTITHALVVGVLGYNAQYRRRHQREKNGNFEVSQVYLQGC